MNKSKNTKLLVCDAYTISTDDNCCLRIVKTGWEDLYCVIVEDAVYGAKMLPTLQTSQEIESQYGHKLPAEALNLNTKVKQVPNDSDLGGAVRSFCNSLN